MSPEIRTKGSLCSGVGGLDSALPGELAWVAETDPMASLVLKREHPEVPNLGDITSPDFPATRVDLLTSGDPCQSMSVAGSKRASMDERFLWPDVMRVVDRIRPKHVFFENVQNVTSVALVNGAEDWRGQKGSVLAMRLSDLSVAGYACRWTILGACSVGGCHHRHRWFLRGRYVGMGAPKAERVTVKCGAPHSSGRILLPAPVARDAGHRGEGSPEYWARRFQHRSNGIPLSAAVSLLPSPTMADGLGGPGTSPGRTGGMNLRTAVTLLPTPRATDGVNGGPNQRGRRGDLTMGSAVQAEHWGQYAEAVALWAKVSNRWPPEPTEVAPRGGRRLNAQLSEWMMGHPRGFLTDDFARNDALRMAGNGAMAMQARAAWDLLA